MNRLDRIRAALEEALAPESLDVQDDSHRHIGHAGSRPGGETHYLARVVSARFTGLSRVQRQRLVNEALAAEFAGGLHAFSMELKAPGEA
ncbi:BolA family transcriptional regulator [Neomegalonema sp.]|uniref:BolA family protein n=1 Tax=Neomegalonema sp. TaxID=2039713 RepID=UPI00262D4B3D|nr:BolA family protein [Neomegalonema sp.]MDD2869571.1 BolA family transcriptional regulator [Neomegalonema sp.]